eukprot:3342699-Rhodomonas_salina.1
MALTTANEDDMETTGEVFACSLVYSGNWIMEAEVHASLSPPLRYCSDRGLIGGRGRVPLQG